VTERTAYYAIFGLFVVGGVVLYRLMVRGVHRRLPTSKRVKRSLRVSLIGPGWLGLAFVWLQSEGIRFFATKFWIVSTLLWVVVLVPVSHFRVWRVARPALGEENEHFRSLRKASRRLRGKKRRRK
jgi:hypothetical protein